MLTLSPINSPFFQSDPHAIIPNKLAFTSFHCSIANHTLKGLRSLKPSHKQDSNKTQFFHLWREIRSDQICDARKTKHTRFDRCIDCYLINTMCTAPIRGCVCGQIQFFKIMGFAGTSFLHSPPPPLSFLFFLTRQQLLCIKKQKCLKRSCLPVEWHINLKDFLCWNRSCTCIHYIILYGMVRPSTQGL